MGRKCRAVNEELYNRAQKTLKQLGKGNDLGHRLQAIVSVKSHGITAVARIYGITRTTLLSWIKNFEKDSLEGLKVKPGRGRKLLVNKSKEEEIREIITKNPHITIDELRLILFEEHRINIGRTTVYRIMKRLRFSYITPRPSHYKSDKHEQAEFKKKCES